MACARVLQQQQGQPQRQQLQHSRQWGLEGAGTTCWSPDHSASRCYRRLDDLHPTSERLCIGATATTSLAPAFVTDLGATSQTAQLSFTLDSGACTHGFFRKCTDITPLRTPVTIALADPSVGPVVAHSTTTLPCPAAPSGFLTGYYTPRFSRNLHAAPHSSFPPTTTPFQTLHLDVWGPSPVLGPRQERYFLIVVDDYSRYTTVFPLRQKADVPTVLEPSHPPPSSPQLLHAQQGEGGEGGGGWEGG
ncbi:unnamed protein product [Closterium sp. NIES-54]